jgi:hypothetical protein
VVARAPAFCACVFEGPTVKRRASRFAAQVRFVRFGECWCAPWVKTVVLRLAMSVSCVCMCMCLCAVLCGDDERWTYEVVPEGHVGCGIR